MNKKNYKNIMDRELLEAGSDSTLLLHACCAPCSSACLTTLKGRVKIKVLYYNPNIVDDAEYELRDAELKRLIKELKKEYPEAQIEFVEGKKEPEKFLEIAKGLEKEPEGGKRCRKCFELRLAESAKLAKELNCDYFTTTLTISPMKDAQVLNEVVQEQCDIYGIKRLPSDFKKKGGYKRSIQLSHDYNLYRQNFCGCVYSMREAEEREANKIAMNTAQSTDN